MAMATGNCNAGRLKALAWPSRRAGRVRCDSSRVRAGVVTKVIESAMWVGLVIIITSMVGIFNVFMM